MTQLDIEIEALKAEIASLRADNERLRAENFSLAAWQCEFTDGKTGLVSHEHGGTYCAMAKENERLRAALRAAFDAGSELGWDHATYSERGGPEPIGHEDAFAAFLAALDGQPALGKEEA